MKARGAAISILGALPRNEIIQFPSGRWGFVGRVSVDLCYERIDGQPLTEDDVNKICRHGAGFLRDTVTCRVWETREQAEAAAAAETEA